MPTAPTIFIHIPDNRYFIGRLVRTLHCKRRYQSCVTRILYAISQKKSRLKHIICTHRSSRVLSQSDSEDRSEGSSHRLYRGCDRFEYRKVVSPRPTITNAFGGVAELAAAIAGIFKAPSPNLVYTRSTDDRYDCNFGFTFIISSITAVTVSYIFTGYNAEFSFVQTEPFVAARIPYVIFLGFFADLFLFILPHYEPYGRYIPPDRDSLEKIHSRFAHSKLFYFSITATVRRRLWSITSLAERQSQTTGRREFILY